MKDILKRDITGKCVGECRNRVLEADRRRQKEINNVQTKVNSLRRYASKSFSGGRR